MLRSTDRALEQYPVPSYKTLFGWSPDRVSDGLGFEELVDLRIGEGRVAGKI
jgi:hypothetical protein